MAVGTVGTLMAVGLRRAAPPRWQPLPLPLPAPLAVVMVIVMLPPVVVAFIVQMMIVCNTLYPSLATPRCPVVSTHGDARNSMETSANV